MKREGWLASLFALGTIATLVGVFVYLIVRDPLPTPINKSTREIAAAEVRPTPPPPLGPLPSPPAPSLLFEPAPAIAAARDPLPLPPPPAPKLPAPQDPPSFDLIRVEPNGAAVLAGQAEPGAKVEIMDAGKAIATGKANLRGEWVLSLDRPLYAQMMDIGFVMLGVMPMREIVVGRVARPLKVLKPDQPRPKDKKEYLAFDRPRPVRQMLRTHFAGADFAQERRKTVRVV